MKKMKLGFLLAGGIVFANLAVILSLIFLSEPDDIASFETAAGTVEAPPSGQSLEMVLRPHPIEVLASNGQTSRGYISIRMAIDDVSHWGEVCHLLPKVREVLAFSFSGRALDRQEWSAVTRRPMADSLRKRFNKALNAVYVKKVIVSHGERPGGKGKLWFCPETVAKVPGQSRR